MPIRALGGHDDRSRFCSGEPDLDRFFQKYAGQNQFRHYIGTTYVFVEDDGLVTGYVTVAAGSIEIDDLPALAQHALPRYPLPVLRIARLAVDRAHQGRGIGSVLLKFVLDLSVRMARDFGCVGVVVDAKPAAVKFYASLGFEALNAVEGHSGARPPPVIMFLPITDITAAAKR